MVNSGEPVNCDLERCDGVLEPTTLEMTFFVGNKALIHSLQPGHKCNNCGIEVWMPGGEEDAHREKQKTLRSNVEALIFIGQQEFRCPNSECDSTCVLVDDLEFTIVIDEETRSTHTPGYSCSKCETKVYSAEQWLQLGPSIMKLVREPAA